MRFDSNLRNKVLIVEDDNFVFESLIRHFKTAGYEVILAQTFARAKSNVDSASYDLVLIDPGLPDLGSEKETSHARNGVVEYIIGATPLAIHLVITGRFSSDEADACRALGAKGYLGKSGLNTPVLANILDKLAQTDFVIHRGITAGDEPAARVTHTYLTVEEEECLQWVESRPTGMKRKELFELMKKHFNLKSAESAEQKYKRARSKIIANRHRLKSDSPPETATSKKKKETDNE